MLLAACDSKDSDTTEIRDISYNTGIVVESDQKNSISDLFLSSDMNLYSKDGDLLKLNNGDQFNILLNGQTYHGRNVAKTLSSETLACCIFEGESSHLLKTDEEHVLTANFIRNNEIADFFELNIPKVPDFIDIAEPNFVYYVNENQDIEIEWQTKLETFSFIELVDDAFCIDYDTNFIELEPNQASVTLPVKNKDVCGADEFSVIIKGKVTSSGNKETALTNAPVSFTVTHQKKVEFKVRFN
jgi:hypothetical protein